MTRALNISGLLAAAVLAGASAPACATTIVLTKLTGLTGGSPANTAVYRGDLNPLGGSFAAISIADASGGFGGAAGQFSGFDLDAIKLSTTFCADAACVAGLAGLNVFDFTSGIVFAPGTQRAPTDSKLFGTGPSGATVDNAVATLGAFDADSIAGFGADGFLSIGDNGSIAFNLTSLTSSAGLYLYIGEVGDNGEVAGSNIDILRDPVNGVPEPSTWAMMLIGFGAIGFAMRRKQRLAVNLNFA